MSCATELRNSSPYLLGAMSCATIYAFFFLFFGNHELCHRLAQFFVGFRCTKDLILCLLRASLAVLGPKAHQFPDMAKLIL